MLRWLIVIFVHYSLTFFSLEGYDRGLRPGPKPYTGATCSTFNTLFVGSHALRDPVVGLLISERR